MRRLIMNRIVAVVAMLLVCSAISAATPMYPGMAYVGGDSRTYYVADMHGRAWLVDGKIELAADAVVMTCTAVRVDDFIMLWTYTIMEGTAIPSYMDGIMEYAMDKQTHYWYTTYAEGIEPRMIAYLPGGAKVLRGIPGVTTLFYQRILAEDWPYKTIMVWDEDKQLYAGLIN